MLTVGVGMEHQMLVDLAKEYFVGRDPIWSEQPSLIDKTKGKDLSISQYTGGVVSVSLISPEYNETYPHFTFVERINGYMYLLAFAIDYQELT